MNEVLKAFLAGGPHAVNPKANRHLPRRPERYICKRNSREVETLTIRMVEIWLWILILGSHALSHVRAPYKDPRI